MTVRTILKPPHLARIIKQPGGLYARTALLQADAMLQGCRDDHWALIEQALDRMAAWRDLPTLDAAGWRALRDAAAEIIALCGAETEARLLKAARLTCQYLDQPGARGLEARVAIVFIDALKTLGASGAHGDTRAQEAILVGLEAVTQR